MVIFTTVFLVIFCIVSNSLSLKKFPLTSSVCRKHFFNSKHVFKHCLQSTSALANASSSHDKRSNNIDRQNIIRESLSGLVVSLSTLPSSAAYSAVIGLNPLVGIWSSIIVGTVVGLLAGGPGVIAGAAGVIAIPLAKLVQQHGLVYMSAATILAAFFEVGFGALGLGWLVNYVTEPVLAGFMNAFAVYLFKSQLKIFKTGSKWLPQPLLLPSIAIAALCAVVTRLSPLVQRAVPGSLVGLFVASLTAVLLKLPVKTLIDVSGPSVFAGGVSSLPLFALPTASLSFATLNIILPTSIAVAMISILETLIARRVACDAPVDHSDAACPVDPQEAEKTDSRSVVALGIANFVSSLFGGFGGCGLIPNTLLNTRNGGASWISSLAYAGSLALCILLLAPVIGKVPVAALAGLMINLAASTFELKESVHIVKAAVKEHNHIGRLQAVLDLVSLAFTSVLCFKVDMGLGVLVGVLIAQGLRIATTVKDIIGKSVASNNIKK